jgi:toluene monooxygenase system protein E
VPSDYEVVTNEVLYYPQRGFEVTTPITAWLDRYQKGSRLQLDDWEAFVDPRATTYSSYVRKQQEAESQLSQVLDVDEPSPNQEWLVRWNKSIAPLRYPCHGLQMLAAYWGSMALSGKLVVVCGFQAADEMRRTHRLAYRLAQLRRVEPTLGVDALQRWQTGASWQPFRALIERLLVTYDWAESLFVTNALLKPLFDLLCCEVLSREAAAGQDMLCRVFESFRSDARWHQEWSESLLRLAISQEDDNHSALNEWIAAWQGTVTEAMITWATEFESDRQDVRSAVALALQRRNRWLEELGLEVPE